MSEYLRFLVLAIFAATFIAALFGLASWIRYTNNFGTRHFTKALGWWRVEYYQAEAIEAFVFFASAGILAVTLSFIAKWAVRQTGQYEARK